jgi:hypothetical protein
MQHHIKDLIGSKLLAVDGAIGHVKDFYLDDQTWAIRYLVADTGSWLTGRLVLLSPHAFGKLDSLEGTLHLKLHRKQIENSPSIESHQPVSRQYEMDYHQYYGWPAYWNAPAIGGFGGYPVVIAPSKDQIEAQRSHRHHEDKHLRSVIALTGYAIHATDGEIGTVRGFLVDDRKWTISQIVVETGHWYAGKEILISPGKVERISYEDSQVFVNLPKAAIQHTAEHEVVKAGA